MPATEFVEKINFKSVKGFSAAASTAAALEHCSMSEFIRRSVFGRMREVGVELLPDGRVNVDQPSRPAASPADRQHVNA
jgi:hypothetical protein